MAYRATHEMVSRVRPLLDHLATTTIEKARLLQYLAAMAGVDWGVNELIGERESATPVEGATVRIMVFRDRGTGARHELPYPTCLTPELDPLVREEYKRLAIDRPLTTMDPALFSRFYGTGFCANCRWRDAEHSQIQRECHFAGYPINFEPQER